jgi:hypothetical protein
MVKASFEKDGITQEDIDQAENILRLEVQCLQGKTNYYKKKYDLQTKYLYEYINPVISRDTILKAYKDTVGLGDFHTLEDAVDMINKTNFRNGHKDDLILLLQLVNSKRSVWKAKEEYIDKASFSRRLHELNVELNINPVTIPKRWGEKMIPSLLTEINRQYESSDQFDNTDALLGDDPDLNFEFIDEEEK